jgi:hypothetical protein
MNLKGYRTRIRISLLRSTRMHDILIALAFVAMVACPAIVARLLQQETDDEA